MQKWYLLYTKTKNEELVASKLVECGFNVFSPVFEERKVVRGKVRTKLTTLFPCYLFVKFDRYKSYNFIKYTRGIRKVVGTENSPTVVPASIIESLEQRMVNGVITVTDSIFEQNEEVAICGGKFQGLNALFMKNLNGSERAMILLKTMNAHIVIDSTYLKKAAN